MRRRHPEKPYAAMLTGGGHASSFRIGVSDGFQTITRHPSGATLFKCPMGAKEGY